MAGFDVFPSKDERQQLTGEAFYDGHWTCTSDLCHANVQDATMQCKVTVYVYFGKPNWFYNLQIL